MKKVLMSLTIILIALCCITVFAFNVHETTVLINNEKIDFKYPISISNDRIYVSLRELCEALGFSVEWTEENRTATIQAEDKKVEISDKTQHKAEGVIPDEETAYIVGKTILEKYAGKTMEYETDNWIYYLEVYDLDDAWRVIQVFKPKVVTGALGGDGSYSPEVKLSKSTGEVLYINTYSTFEGVLR